MTPRKTPVKYRRGKAFLVRHGETVDWSSFPLGSRPDGVRRIERCGKCGRKGQVFRFASGRSSFTHSSRFESFAWMVLDVCDVPA